MNKKIAYIRAMVLTENRIINVIEIPLIVYVDILNVFLDSEMYIPAQNDRYIILWVDEYVFLEGVRMSLEDWFTANGWPAPMDYYGRLYQAYISVEGFNLNYFSQGVLASAGIGVDPALYRLANTVYPINLDV